MHFKEDTYLARRHPKPAKTARLRGKCFPVLMLLLPVLCLVGYRQIQSYFDHPDGILMLGGSTSELERERFTAEFASQHPNLPIWVSSGGRTPLIYEKYTKLVFADVGVDPSYLHFDYQAQDTVTNFTTLVDELQAKGIDSVYLITSDYHMHRAWLVGEIILGSRGIRFKAVAVPSNQTPEPIEKVLRDGARALLWVTTGHTGLTLKRVGQSGQRYPGSE